MTIEDVINQGYISIDDDIRFKYHVEVLRLFGKNFKAHMQATYKLDENWRVWFPKLYRNGDFINELLNADKTFEMNQLPTSSIASQKYFPRDEPGERIIFAHFKNRIANEKYYKFVGVFTELTGDMQHASCQRISTTLHFDNKGSFSIETLAE
ncbi:hypothetical protein KBC31_03285 [Candidatus Saccharibacteria bacterium]|jgi:hypothetical protein|nr:hypothetical protein [Candidatus Saccharibacteria bacterium]